MKQCKLVFVAATVALLAGLCHATPAHVTGGSRAVKGTQKSVGKPEARETDTEMDSDEVTSSTQPSEGEYIILDKNGDEEASIVVSKGSVKAKEEANLMSLYQWLAAYFEGKGQETGKHHEHWGAPPKGGYYQQSYNPAYHPGYPYPNYRGYKGAQDYRSATSFNQLFPNFQSSNPYPARNYYSAQSSYPATKYGQYPYGQYQFGGYPQYSSYYGGYSPYGGNQFTSRYSQYGGYYGGQPQNNMYQYPNYPYGNYQNLGRISQYGTSQSSVPKFNNYNSNSYMIKYPQYTESESGKDQHREESEFAKYFPDVPGKTSTSEHVEEKSTPSDQGSYQYGVFRQA